MNARKRARELWEQANEMDLTLADLVWDDPANQLVNEPNDVLSALLELEEQWNGGNGR